MSVTITSSPNSVNKGGFFSVSGTVSACSKLEVIATVDGVEINLNCTCENGAWSCNGTAPAACEPAPATNVITVRASAGVDTTSVDIPINC